MRASGWLVMAGLLAGGAAHPVHAREGQDTPSTKQQARAFFEDGVRKQEAGDCVAAIRAYDVALAYQPKQAEALSRRGACYRQLEQYPKALADYEAALQLEPKNRVTREAAEALKTLMSGATPASTP